MSENQDWPGEGSSIADRLKWARIMRGFSSPRAAATGLNFVFETYKKHETGERGADGMKEHFIKRYARGFRINKTWLQTAVGSPFAVTYEELSPEEQRMIDAYRAAKQA